MIKKRLLFQLNHPAHFHLFKNCIRLLKKNGHTVLISIKDKDILKNLVKDHSYVQLSEGYRKKNLFSIISSLFRRGVKLAKVAKDFKPDLMIGTSPEIGQISPFIRVPSLFFGEDDVNLSMIMYLAATTCYPLFDSILAPNCVNNGVWNRKTTFYNGFQKLAYLHPNHFTPERSKVKIDISDRYYIIRFSALTAYHDTGIGGIDDTLAFKIISILTKKGKVVISSERELPSDFEQHRFKGDPSDMHHYLAFADLFIGDSQSMCAESGLLGTPFVRYNDFVGKIGYLNELENEYQVGYGVEVGNEEELLNKISELSSMPNAKDTFNRRKQKILADKIDATAFYVWFIENYPESRKQMKANPDIQNRFL